MLVIGHRGAAGHEVENTLPSFETAIAQGADMVEMDIRQCETGELVVHHESTLYRTGEHIADLPFQTLQQKAPEIPTLQEALHKINKRVHVNIEIKTQGVAQNLHALLMRITEQYQWDKETFLLSGAEDVYGELEHLHTLQPMFPLGIIYHMRLRYCPVFAHRINPLSIHPDANQLTPEAIKDIRRHKTLLYPFTVNTLEGLREMAQLKVDGVFTDYPDRVRGWLGLTSP